ncbi:hypothetical protein VTK56DRAFT_5120 [Thermocarpiscus australiensis]
MYRWYQRSPWPVLLLLLLSPNLKAARFAVYKAWNTAFIAPKLADGTVEPKVTIPSLTWLEMRVPRLFVNQRPLEAVDMTKFYGLLAATPNLRVLVLRDFLTARGPLPLLPQLTSLSLIHTCLPGDGIRHIARSCPNLRRFCTTYHVLDRYEGLAADILTWLAPARATLENMSLDGCAPPASAEFGVAPNGTVRRIGEFPALRILGINYDNVHRSSSFHAPGAVNRLITGCERLQALVIYQATAIDRMDLFPFARAVSEGHFPSLRRVKFVSSCWFPCERSTYDAPLLLWSGYARFASDYNERMWHKLREKIDRNVELMFKTGNVEIQLEKPNQHDRLRTFQEMEKELGMDEYCR